LWDSDHTTSDFLYLLDWIEAYELRHYPIGNEEEFGAGLRVFEKISDIPVSEEKLEAVARVVEADEIADLSHIVGVFDFKYSVSMVTYLDKESDTYYYPATGVRLINRVSRFLELLLQGSEK
jgi:hypothetical protein